MVKRHIVPSRAARVSEKKPSECPVVGIGASAGGLEAFSQLIENLTPNSNLAYVLIQHMDPTQPSLLPQLLAKLTEMPVHQVRDGMKIEANHIYVIPPNATLSLLDGHLKLVSRQGMPVPHMPIDYFFRSLADLRKHKAIGVILSGTGSDGVLGLSAIKAAGGFTIAQDDQSAKFSAMSKRAVESGSVDLVLSPQEIAGELNRIGRHPYFIYSAIEANGQEISPADQKSLGRVVAILRSVKAVDFSFYKPATFQRRLARRMALQRIKGLSDYADYLENHPPEVEALYKDVLINVTRFFRDPKAFGLLEEVAFPALIKNRPHGKPIRLWVPGCSTGEEAYSIAIALLDFLAHQKLQFPIQVFASDISEEIVSKARQGLFPENIKDDVSPERLGQYFEPWEGGYRIAPRVRGLCTFVRHNLLGDPPFSKLDLISCRNVMIYWDPALQKKIFSMFHFALEPKGFLLLGSAESMRHGEPLFETVDKKHQIYLKKPAERPQDFHWGLPAHVATTTERLAARPGASSSRAVSFDPQREADQIARKLYSPAGLLVDNDLQIVQVRGDVNSYTSLSAGKATLHLMQMVSPNLAKALSALITQAREKDSVVQKVDHPVDLRGRRQTVTLRVFPIRGDGSKKRFFLIFFEEKSVPGSSKRTRSAGPQPKPKRIDFPEENTLLKEKLFAMEAHLEAMLAKSEALNEELRSSNEEILSANEELLAGNEELETTKEELQATNEELVTLNSELKSSNFEVGLARDRLQMIMDTMRQPLIVLDSQLRILETNRAFNETFKTNPSLTIHRPLYDLGDGQWNIPALRKLLESILPQQHTVTDYRIEFQLPDIGRRLMMLDARKVNLCNGEAERILVAMDDITDQDSTHQKLSEKRQELQDMNVRLEERVDQRTKELARSNEALQQARQLEAIGRLAGGVAHDFNNLMTGIMGMAQEILPELPESGEPRENMAEIIQAAQKACDLTKQLLAFGRRQVFAPRILDLNQVIRDIQNLLPRFLGENTEIKTTLEPNLPSIRGDRTQLEQVILNLVTNSRDAMPRGGLVTFETKSVELTGDLIQRQNDLKTGPYVRLSVSDTGFGMDKETLRRVFEPFFTTKEQGKGTGLGLATTYGIVKQHEGDLSVYSEPGMGTTFKIYFPLVRENADVERWTVPRGSVPSGSETVLVVEDEAIVRRVATKALRNAGYHILEARTGPEALELAYSYKNPIDLLLTDVIMPGMDGRQLALQLQGKIPALPVLYMSGYPQDVIVSRGMLEPGICFIEKSFSAEALCHKVRAVLDKRTSPNI